MKLVFICLALSVLALGSQLAFSDQRITPSGLQGLAEQVSATRIENDIRRLAGFGTRLTLSETESDTRGIGAARRWSVRVGVVTAHTLKNIVIDNYLFGVSSNAENGMASSVVFSWTCRKRPL